MSTTAEAVDQAWEGVERSWDDDQAHRRFIAFCAAQALLPEAGRRYREVAEHDQARRERAERQLAAVQNAAWLNLQATRAPLEPRRRSRLAWAVGGVCLVLCGYGILSVLRLFAR